jgi:hypothetical protein
MDDKGKRRRAAKRRTPREGAAADRPTGGAVKHKPENRGDDRDGQGRFAEGNPGGPGRRLGSRNRTPAMLREAFLNAFDDLGAQAWLVAQAKKDPRTFIRCLARMLPREIKIADEPELVIPWPDLEQGGQAGLEAIAKARAKG